MHRLMHMYLLMWAASKTLPTCWRQLVSPSRIPTTLWSKERSQKSQRCRTKLAWNSSRKLRARMSMRRRKTSPWKSWAPILHCCDVSAHSLHKSRRRNFCSSLSRAKKAKAFYTGILNNVFHASLKTHSSSEATSLNLARLDTVLCHTRMKLIVFSLQMKESDAKMAEIKKNLDMIEERLAKLDAEKEELSQYYQLDKWVFCAEYELMQIHELGNFSLVRMAALNAEIKTLRTSNMALITHWHAFTWNFHEYTRALCRSKG